MEHTKAASGLLWCRAEEPVLLGKNQSGIAQDMFPGTCMPYLSLISAGIHINRGGGPGHTAAAIGLGTVWVWGGTGCASQGDSSP
eukprot:731204-Pelagomonas_calceolata.AAC.1